MTGERRLVPAGRRRRRSGSGWHGATPLRGLLPLGVGLLLWELLGEASSFSYPVPSTWLSAIERIYEGGVLMPALGTTLKVFCVGFLASVVLGVTAGMLIGASRTLERALAPLLDFLRTLPAPAIVPFSILLLGANTAMGVVTVVFASVWPILLNTVTAMRGISRVRLDVSRALGLTRRDRLVKVVIPSLVPGVAPGLRIAISVALVTTLLVDILGGTDGIGHVLLESQQLFDAEGVYGIVLIIGVFGYVLNTLIGLAEKAVMRSWG